MLCTHSISEVNQGAAEVARVFLGNPSAYPVDKMEELKVKMTEFLMACSEAVQLNGKLTEDSQDQREISFQAEMITGYNSLAQEINKLMDNKLTVSTNLSASTPVIAVTSAPSAKETTPIMPRRDTGDKLTKRPSSVALALKPEKSTQ